MQQVSLITFNQNGRSQRKKSEGERGIQWRISRGRGWRRGREKIRPEARQECDNRLLVVFL